MNNKPEIQNKTDHFPPDVSFFELKIVWTTIKSVCITSVIISLSILMNSNLEFDWSFSGWNNFITYFKVPLAILALLIPFGAIYAANHRSNQTLQQMKLTTEQNNFANYYKHLEEFEKYCAIHHPQIMNTSYRHLHSLIFSGAHEGNYKANDRIIKIFESSIPVIVDEIKNKGWSNNELYNSLANYTSNLIRSSQLKDSEMTLLDYQINAGNILENRYDEPLEKNLIMCQLSLCYLGSVYKTIIEASCFDTSFTVPRKVARLMNRLEVFYDRVDSDDYTAQNNLAYIQFQHERKNFSRAKFSISITTEGFCDLMNSSLNFILEKPSVIESSLGVNIDDI